uniref:Uncharacterized protein n=1 Tax=Physcomitrium patens TaxID=3218 RepID=A0A7I4FG96_PHYPA
MALLLEVKLWKAEEELYLNAAGATTVY